MALTKKVLAPGKAKPQPFTVCIFANPFLETPWKSGTFVVDPVMSREPDFDASAVYIADCIRGLVAGQKEKLFDPTMTADMRIVSIFDTGLASSSANSLAANDGSSELLIARRDSFAGYASGHSEFIDVGFAVTGSTTHKRATTWFASDDDAGGGVPFTLDGVTRNHRFRSLIPGAVAIHVDTRSLTPLHEFQHALGSYTNGGIVDLYVDSNPDVNCKTGRPIPVNFAMYDGVQHLSDQTRDGLGYLPGWSSFHCALFDATRPAVMDDYTQKLPPVASQNDTITRQFVIDRIRARMMR